MHPTQQQQAATLERTKRSREQRACVNEALARGELPTSIDAPERVRSRLERWGVSDRPEAVRPGLERVLGDSNLVPASSLERAASAARCVARVRIRDDGGSTVGWGTGFMISPSLLITNNHVLTSAADAQHSRVEFNYQDGLDGKPMPAASFDLKPQVFFETDAQLDFTVVAVDETSHTVQPLTSFGHARLIKQEGKALLGEYLNIIQHPNGEPKQVAVRENRLVARLDQFLHYETDTAPGSSGSPVFNDQWEVVALHHSGVPATDEQGRLLNLTGGLWSPDQGEQRLQWIANEGVRVSTICHELEKRAGQMPEPRRALIRSALSEAPIEHAPIVGVPPSHDSAFAQPSSAATTLDWGSQQGNEESTHSASPAAFMQGAVATWVIPLQISAQLGGSSPPIGGSRSPRAQPEPVLAALPAQAAPTLLPDAEVLAELREAKTRPYYDAAEDRQRRAEYYAGFDFSARDLLSYLSALLEQTHENLLRYKPIAHVYPWLDVHPDGFVRSIYSGHKYKPEEIIEEDLKVEAARARRKAESLHAEASVRAAELDALEAQLPYNCEHVVPQSWFDKREPMRGDLHHLFTCESGCNSFRGNTPYYDFADFEEVIREACGKREVGRFEPTAGKGPVARAVLYFAVRYPGEINATDREYEFERIKTLIAWHQTDPVSEYERHRNRVAQHKQGNRNPFVDFPDLASKLDFRATLG